MQHPPARLAPQAAPDGIHTLGRQASDPGREIVDIGGALDDLAARCDVQLRVLGAVRRSAGRAASLVAHGAGSTTAWV